MNVRKIFKVLGIIALSFVGLFFLAIFATRFVDEPQSDNGERDMQKVEKVAPTSTAPVPAVPVPQGPDVSVAIDLGLPSGTLWAPYNVGASGRFDVGDYFAWGETKPKSKTNADWSNYKWMNKGGTSFEQINKYTMPDHETGADWYTDGKFTGDCKTKLDPEDDAASANWGPNWQMPTEKQLQELLNNCDFTWIDVCSCLRLTGPNGKEIYLPGDGIEKVYKGDDSYTYEGSIIYWSSDIDTTPFICSCGEAHESTKSYYAGGLYLEWFEPFRSVSGVYRCKACPVRAVVSR